MGSQDVDCTRYGPNGTAPEKRTGCPWHIKTTTTKTGDLIGRATG